MIRWCLISNVVVAPPLETNDMDATVIVLRDLKQTMDIMTPLAVIDSQDSIASWIFGETLLFLFSFALPRRREKKKS